MQGLKHPRLLRGTTRRKSFDSKELKLPSIYSSQKVLHDSRKTLPSLLKFEIGPSQRSLSIKHEKENGLADFQKTVNESVSLASTLQDLSIEGTTSPQHDFRRRFPQKKRCERTSPPIKIQEIAPKKTTQVSDNAKSQLKEWLYSQWSGLFQSSCGLVPTQPTSNYKFYIGKGNNSPLVNQVMKTRWWWTRVGSPHKANLVWTQLKHKPTLEQLSTNPLPISVNQPSAQPPKPRMPRSMVRKQTEASGFALIADSDCYSLQSEISCMDPSVFCVHNHLHNSSHISCKKRLLQTMRSYYQSRGRNAFQKIPLSFHVAGPSQMQEFLGQHAPGSMWIVKPGEGTNRGNGIIVSKDLDEIKEKVLSATEQRSFVIQKYILNPLLIHRRKFDIRCYGLIKCIGKQMQGYFYREGYIRTASQEFSLKKPGDRFVHLTNDAVQKKSEDYGKFQMGNKLSYQEFQRYLSAHVPGVDFYAQIMPEIEKAVTDSLRAIKALLTRSHNTFEIFGYDFMVDQDLKVWLIQVNSNPCLELSCSYLAKVIPAMLDNAFSIALDPIFTPPVEHKRFKHWIQDYNMKNNFVLVFSEDY